MKLKNLFTEDRAVSPVIGVILMVAITVILAAVIGTFVIGLGDDLGGTAPSASFDNNYDDTENTVEFTHRGGDRIVSGESVLVAGGNVTFDEGNEDNSDDINIEDGDTRATVDFDLSAGTTVTMGVGADEEGEVRLVFDNGDRSATLSTVTVG